MLNITASLVKDLREKSGAGMMDCKKALVECNGNFDEAMDWLRKKGIANAAKKSGRVAAEGLVGILIGTNNKEAAIIELNAETDFVARNDQFQKLALESCKIAFENKGDLNKTLSSAYNGKTFADEIKDKISVIGENINLRRASFLSVDNGVVAGYVHNTIANNLGKIAVLVALESNADKARLDELGKKIAMHIAAERPIYLHKKEVDQATIDKEKEIFTEQSLASGKPKEIVEQMVEGRIKKFLKEICLLEQVFVMDNKISITELLNNSSKELGSDVAIKSFIRLELGEGIEQEETNFADEVASLTK